MRVRVVRDLSELVALKGRWDQMLEGSDHDLPFYSWAWYSTWWKHFGRGSDLLVLVAEEHLDRVEGIAPLLRTRTCLRGFPLTEVRFLDNSIGPRNAILLRPGDVGRRALKGIVQYLVDHRAEWDLATLTNIDAAAFYLAELVTLAQHSGLRVLEEPGRQSPFVQINGDFSTYCARNFDSKQRNNIRRRLRMLSARGQYRVIGYSAPSDMENALTLAFQVSASSWKAQIGTHMNGSRAREAFYREITTLFAEQRQVRIWVATLDELPIAMKYQLVSEEAFHSLVSDFDERFRNLSPINIMMYHILEQLHVERKQKFDFCGNMYEYQKLWATGVKPHVTLQLFNRRLYSQFLFAAKGRILPLVRTVRAGLYRRVGGHKGALNQESAK